MVSIEVSKTYEVVTEESAKEGDAAERGYCFSPMFLRLKDTLEEVSSLGSFDLSDHSDIGHIDLYGHQEEINYQTGEHTTYSLRIKGKPRVIGRIIKLIKGN